jgi:type VI secretion system protein ImpJ
MTYLSRVVWSEGMYLAPQHFQVQRRYMDDALHFVTSALWIKPWGLSACEMCADSLRNGVLSVLNARGIFPDGLPFDIPEGDAGPAAREITNAASPIRDSHIVLLGVPADRRNGPNCSYDTAADHYDYRFITDRRLVRDETDPREEEPIDTGRKNFRLLLDTEVTDGCVALPLARIQRANSGAFVYDPTFVPPCTSILASSWLLRMLHRLLETLEQRAVSIDAPRQQAQSGLADYYRREISSFWFLHTINSSLVPLRSLLQARNAHPEQLYRELARLAGALCSFSINTHPRELPAYDHERLSECFSKLEEHIRVHLDLISPANFVQVRLQPDSRYTWSCDVNDSRCLGAARWILGVRTSANEADMIVGAPRLIKISSREDVPERVRRAIPGLALTHLPVPPPTIPAKVDAQYFSISKGGDAWDQILKTKQVGIYVPGDLPSPDLELLVILES